MDTSKTSLVLLPSADESQNVAQYFDYVLILDFEATCQEGRKINPQEVIEFPCALLNTRNGFKTESIFHKYVRPIHHPLLTPYCTNLTGITQETVSQADTFETVFSQFKTWLENEQGLVVSATESTQQKFAFVTCGDWDLRYMLPEQCRVSQVSIPGYMKSWINIKASFASSLGIGKLAKAKGLSSMLQQLGMVFEGRPHSGIDDVKNIVRIVETLAKNRNFVFETTSFL